MAKNDQGDDSKEVSSEKIKSFLRPDNFEIIDTANLIVVYDIKKTLVDSITNEYSNKTVLNDTLKNEKSNKLLALLKKDTSYKWSADEVSGEFDPSRQILVRNDKKRIFLLIDENRRMIGFINMEGQKVLQLAHDVPNFFEDF